MSHSDDSFIGSCRKSTTREIFSLLNTHRVKSIVGLIRQYEAQQDLPDNIVFIWRDVPSLLLPPGCFKQRIAGGMDRLACAYHLSNSSCRTCMHRAFSERPICTRISGSLITVKN